MEAAYAQIVELFEENGVYGADRFDRCKIDVDTGRMSIRFTDLHQVDIGQLKIEVENVFPGSSIRLITQVGGTSNVVATIKFEQFGQNSKRNGIKISSIIYGSIFYICCALLIATWLSSTPEHKLQVVMGWVRQYLQYE